MDEDDYRYIICRTVTGEQLAEAFPLDAPWARKLNQKASGTATFSLDDDRNIDIIADDTLTSEWVRELVIERKSTGNPVYGGLITGSKYKMTGNMLTVDHTDFRALVGKRSTEGEDGYSTINYRGEYHLYSKQSIINLLWRLMVEGPTTGYPLNFTHRNVDALDPAQHDGTDSRDYYDYNLPWTDKSIDELMNSEGGPDVDYPFEWDENRRFRWLGRTGTTAQPSLIGNTWKFDLTAPEPGLFDVEVTRNGDNMATDVIVAGAGAGLDRKFAVARMDTELALQRMVSMSTIDDVAVLQSHANAQLATYSSATIQWSFWVLADGTPDGAPAVDQIQLGDIFEVYSNGLPRIPNGVTNLRVIGKSANRGKRVDIEVQPIGGL
ncbi:hypothetical protein BH09ACT9_BH09ACT9_00760 [soil metagenome]